MVEATDDQAMSDGVRDPTPENIKKVPYVSRGRDEPTIEMPILSTNACAPSVKDAFTAFSTRMGPGIDALTARQSLEESRWRLL